MKPFAALLACLTFVSTARADLFLGTAFRIHEFVDQPDAWKDVRASATGYYFHPRSGNEDSELKGTRQQEITRLFAHQDVITERNNGGAADGDQPQYELMRSVGMTPVGGLVAEVNSLEPFVQRVARSNYLENGQLKQVPLYADQRPWTSEWNQTADIPAEKIDAFAKGNAGLTQRLKIMTAGAGFALETDLTRSMAGGRVDPTLKHFRICVNMLRYARLHDKRTLLFLHGFEDADIGHYVENNLQIVRALEAADAYPDGFIASFYSPKSPLPFLPETKMIAGQKTPAETFSGLAWAVLVREGAIELPEKCRPRATVTAEPAVGDAPAVLNIRIDNPNVAIDFAPALVIDAGTAKINIAYAFGNETFHPLTGNALPLVGPHALAAGGTQTIRLRLSRDANGGPIPVHILLRHHAFAHESPQRTIFQTQL